MTDPTPTKTARLSEESLAFATVLNAEAARADRAERLEFATRRGRDAAIARAEKAEAAARDLVDTFSSKHKELIEEEARAIAAEARAIAAEAENSRLRHAAAEVLSWSINDMTALLTNPPQNAALYHAQRLLREAMGD